MFVYGSEPWLTSPAFCHTTAEQWEPESQFVAVPSDCTQFVYLRKKLQKVITYSCFYPSP